MQLIIGLGAESGTGGPFDLINGIPVHPLVVHAAVVLTPMAAIGLIVMVFSKHFSKRFGWVVAALGAGAFVAAWIAKEAGEALEERVGEPDFNHGALGDRMPLFALALMLAAVALWLIDRTASAQSPRRALRIFAAAACLILAVGNVVWVYRVGDSGAKSVWSGEVSQSSSG